MIEWNGWMNEPVLCHIVSYEPSTGPGKGVVALIPIDTIEEGITY